MPLEIHKHIDWERIRKMKDFENRTQIKLRTGVKRVLDHIKEHKRETYDDTISRLIVEHGLLSKDIPLFILETIDERIEEVHQGRVFSVKDAKKRVFDNEGNL